MRKILIVAGALALTGGVSACSFSSSVASLAAVISHSNQACSDVALLGGDVQSVASQVGAANPNNSSIKSIVSKIDSGVAASNSDCQSLAAAFKAEAPRDQLKFKHVKLTPELLAKIK